jgi:hypothetical protein
MQNMTASGAVNVSTLDGTALGHGWGEVRMRRDPTTGVEDATGEVRTMRWTAGLPPPSGTYRVAFYGGESYVGVFEGGFPEAGQQRASFRPSRPSR